jgi:DNA-binding MarR family transcriptional regulator
MTRVAAVESLANFFTHLRHFTHYAANSSKQSGLSPMLYQLLLAVAAAPTGFRTVSQLANVLLLSHHGAVTLVTRAEALGLIQRQRDSSDRRIVRVMLTASGARRLNAVAQRNLLELARRSPNLQQALQLALASD